MSDLREAFEKWALSTGKYMPKQFSRDPDSGRYTHVMLEVRWEAWQAALQSQTAPAVPKGLDFDLISAVLEDYADLQTSGVISCANRYAASDANEQAELLDMLAAPQPDHSPDGEKKIGDQYDLGVALSRHFDELRDSETGHIAFDPCDSNDIDEVLAIISAHLSPAPAADGGINAVLNDAFRHGTGFAVFDESGVNHVERCKVIAAPVADDEEVEPTNDMVMAFHDALTDGPISENDFNEIKIGLRAALTNYTHPAQPRNEVQAEALERFSDWLKRQSFAHKKRWTSAANEALRCAARLRSNGGDE